MRKSNHRRLVTDADAETVASSPTIYHERTVARMKKHLRRDLLLRLVSAKVSVPSLSVDATMTSYSRRAEGLLHTRTAMSLIMRGSLIGKAHSAL